MSSPRDGLFIGSALSSSPDTVRDVPALTRQSSNGSDHVRLPRPVDPDARERQRTMDVDMAMQLSRARRETLNISPEISPLSDRIHEEEGDRDRMNHDILGGHGIDDELSRSPSRFDLGMRLPPPQDSSLLAHPQTANVSINAEPLFGLPTYQANASYADFDFAPMEEFAAAEKRNLGISSSPPKFSLEAFLSPHRSQGAPLIADGRTESLNDQVEGPPRPSTSARHRTISVSQPHPRPYRKVIGRKMALFENPHFSQQGIGGMPSLTSRFGFSRGQPDSSMYDNLVPGSAPLNGGILNNGHDRPYRFSFYSNALAATIHARSLSELPAEGQSFCDLFSGNHSPEDSARAAGPNIPKTPTPPQIKKIPGGPPGGNGRADRPGDSDTNTWWLDVLSPVDDEMKMLSQVFSIHPLTVEDILMEETREKIELFRNYYFVCFRSFDQDQYSPTYLEPINFYMVVFREGILSFHFRPTPHPQNVRRRIKQLKDYIAVTSDWICYALIDDITDAFGPLIQNIEYEVDSIDELVLILKDVDQSDMLRRIGTCRKKVMGLLRLMGNKADVVKGLAKRCNENWRVAPTSDIGLYLSDIQDHLITMTQNLNHYEKILSRSHSNYLAQISIEMTEANNQINDVLSKLTALGTVLIPMNLVTGLWGMNVHVPGQDVPGYAWFCSIIAGLAAFAVIGGYTTYRLIGKR